MLELAAWRDQGDGDGVTWPLIPGQLNRSAFQ